MSKVQILDAHFDTMDLGETVDALMKVIDEGGRAYPCPVNVNIIMKMRTDPAVRRYVEGARYVVADGLPLVWLSNLWYPEGMPERVAGIDLMDALIKRAAKDGHSVYFLGASGEVMERLIKHLEHTMPDLKIAGYADGFFSEEEAPARVEAIAKSNAQLLMVCMGVPRQERFLDKYWDQLNVNVVLAGGGAFDVLSGLKSRAPKVWSKTGFEWLYRLLQDPKRYATRYMEIYPKFTALVAAEAIQRPFRRSDGEAAAPVAGEEKGSPSGPKA